MKFKKYLNENIDSEDWGSTGKKFEKVFLKACELVGLGFTENAYAGKLWDFHPKGPGWNKFLSNNQVNIKVYGSKWMFGSTELYKMLPWKKLPEYFNVDKANAKVKRYLNKIGLNKIVFLKPKNKDIQSKIIELVKNKNVEELNELMTKKNFLVQKLSNYKVRILTNKERVTSIAIDSGGKVFMRSEKPREMGSGKSIMVTFRTPTPKISKKERKVKE